MVAGVTVFTIALSFPFLAVNDPVITKVVVVEGWIDPIYLPEVARLLKKEKYETIYITGTPRNFSYTLRQGDTVVVELQRERTGLLVLNTCGGKNAGFEMLADKELVLADTVNASCYDRTARLHRPSRELRLTPTHAGSPDPDWELLFTLYATLDGVNLHALQRSVSVHRANGRIEPGTPSFADACAEELVRAGLDAGSIRRLPTVMLGDSRTWANAQRFAIEAKAWKIDHVDVISFGIHARRSRVTYQQACGNRVKIGIRCIEDPELQRGRWWRSFSGWAKVVKELVGIPAAYLVEERSGQGSI